MGRRLGLQNLQSRMVEKVGTEAPYPESSYNFVPCEPPLPIWRSGWVRPCEEALRLVSPECSTYQSDFCLRGESAAASSNPDVDLLQKRKKNINLGRTDINRAPIHATP